MPAPISLKHLAGKLEEAAEEWRQLLHITTGAIVSVSDEHLGLAEEMEPDADLSARPEWERGMIRDACQILANWDEYAALPSPHDIHEYAIMRDFAESINEQPNSDILLLALQGSGAFRRFKDALILTGLRDSWFAFRSDALANIARSWCDEHIIPYTD